jgi:4-hydroxy-3-methylbut-2-enyl diphosphate reductase IspH
MQEHIEHMSQSSNSFSRLKEVSRSHLKKSSKVNSNEDLRQSKKYSISNTNKDMNFIGAS